MAAQTLISSNGQFDSDCLRSLPSEREENVSVVTAVGAYGLQQRTLLNAIFNTPFATDAAEPPTISTAVVEGHNSAIVAEPPCHLLVLNVESFDGPRADRDDVRELAWHLSLSVSNVVLFVVHMHDLARPQSNGLSAIQASLTQLLILQADSVVPTPPGKRAFLVLVKDYEADILQRQEIVSGFMQLIETVYTKVAKPSRSPSRITDLFDFEFALFPNQSVAETDYNTAIDALKVKLTDPTADDYLFENAAYARGSSISIIDAVEGAWNRMDKDRTQNMPPKKDLMSAFECGNAMRKVFDKYQASVRVWARETEGGVIIDKFGEAAASIVKDTITVFEQDAIAYKGSKAFKRKRDELKDLIDADLYNLFVVQVAKLREVTNRVFKEKLDAIEDSESRLDKEVNAVLKECEKTFRTNAEALRPDFASWRYDNDAKELASKMREEATDKLQRARLADYQEGGGRRGRRRRAAIASAAPKKRQPISLGIHYLDPAPFGLKDSRYEKLNMDDSISYNTDAPTFGDGRGSGGSSGGMSVPLAPSRSSGWHRSNQDLIYTERK